MSRNRGSKVPHPTTRSESFQAGANMTAEQKIAEAHRRTAARPSLTATQGKRKEQLMANLHSWTDRGMPMPTSEQIFDGLVKAPKNSATLPRDVIPSQGSVSSVGG